MVLGDDGWFWVVLGCAWLCWVVLGSIGKSDNHWLPLILIWIIQFRIGQIIIFIIVIFGNYSLLIIYSTVNDVVFMPHHAYMFSVVVCPRLYLWMSLQAPRLQFSDSLCFGTFICYSSYSCFAMFFINP